MAKTKRTKVKPQRTHTERAREAEIIQTQMSESLGLSNAIPCIKLFNETLSEFVETGVSVSGSIPFPEDHRKIHYIFTNNKNINPCIKVGLVKVA